DGIEIKLLHADRTEATFGETGEIALRGKYIAPAFWTGSKIEQYGLDDDGWFRTGDLGRCDSDGVFEHLGRKDDQLKLRGQWVSIGEIEGALMRIDGVREAAVVVRQQPGNQEKIVGFVSSNNGILPAWELRSALAVQLPAHALPH